MYCYVACSSPSTHMDINFQDSCFCIYGCSCCFGGLAKSPSMSDKNVSKVQSRSNRQSLRHSGTGGQCSSGSEAVEKTVSACRSNDAIMPLGPAAINTGKMVAEENENECTFVNHAALAWNEMRKEWVGDRPTKAHHSPKEPSISWCTTYEDLLSTTRAFPKPIPLSEMVDFLVDLWHEEGLYD